jgi:2-polyprenyl-3-methyl-5-hydroxy-6-metoxy-1,4-benzoquinol methylase
MLDLRLLVAPLSRQPLELESDQLLRDPEGTVRGRWIAAERRVEWIEYNHYPALDNVMLKEVEKYDEWAESQRVEPLPDEQHARFALEREPIYTENANYRAIGERLSDWVAGKRVLEIGGSCIDGWRLLAGGAAELHQVEVSAGSQRLGLRRVASKLPGRELAQLPVTFHTSPAEYLPFAEQSFDFVFSRSSIHHTQRPLAIAEIARVLRPGGGLLFFEPLQTDVSKAAMNAARRLRGADRGTDDPLCRGDLDLMRKHFAEVRVRPARIVDYDLPKALAWLLRGKKPSVPVIFASGPHSQPTA